jgi:squalene-hopene/tetraprenyl-beta-curcumene cyclase
MPQLKTCLLCFLLWPIMAFPSEPARDNQKIDEAIRKAAAFLLSQQKEEGHWPSRTYGVLNSGQALTPFVLNALLQVPPEVAEIPRAKLELGFAWLRKSIAKEGAVGLDDPQMHEYPNYASAMSLMAFVRDKRAGKDDAAAIEKLALYLRAQQMANATWPKDHAAYGAWGYGRRRDATDPGHVDISMTRHVMQALRMSLKDGAEFDGFAKALQFLARVQNFDPASADADGGFIFSNVIPGLNKGGKDGARHRSYGSPTADGILALLAAGVKRDDPRMIAAIGWLEKHHATGGKPDAPNDDARGMNFGIRFYYAAVSAEVLSTLKIEKAGEQDWRKPLLDMLLASQREDGSFSNQNFMVKEDDPLIATPLALLALLRARR